MSALGKAGSATARPSPREVFDDPTRHASFLCLPTDDLFEGQHFDCKEAGRAGQGHGDLKKELENVRELVRKTLSAFSNVNQEGGVLMLGIDCEGRVIGLDLHLHAQRRHHLVPRCILLADFTKWVAWYATSNHHSYSLLYS